MKNLLLIASLMAAFITADVFAGAYSNRVTQLAEDYRDNLSGDKLYGMTYRDGLTQNGRLACARVVQIVLKKAGVPGFGGALYSVAQIQGKTRGWKTVEYDDIEAGDIVFWKKAGHDDKCTGGGDCHVGIAVGNGQSFDNNGIWGRPEISRISYRMRWRFMYAKRMR
ncbi:MAG: hypothetical protein EP326_03905 [Deltaproteobacteria bacterium]|nr:MAG: hypothetical protein EP326_03905 [Deltaproteobacteria bacterium]TNF30142.1 MAG: hypothetical protein EP319_06015 [Deltaproteobacteria bacterium]